MLFFILFIIIIILLLCYGDDYIHVFIYYTLFGHQNGGKI